MGDSIQDFDIKIAQISSAHGLKGCVKLMIFLEKNEDILCFDKIFDASGLLYTLTPLSKKTDHWIVQIQGVDSREKAESLRNTALYIKRSALPNLSENQFYHEDLTGMTVLKNDKVIGVVKAVVNFGAGDLLEIQLSNNKNTIYHPFSIHFIQSIDQVSKKIYIIN